MNRCNLDCVFQCNAPETQTHIFEECQPVLSKINKPQTVKLEDIYGDISQQKEAVKVFTQIDLIRNSLKESILPGGVFARTLADT